jgi:hypothetical protein
MLNITIPYFTLLLHTLMKAKLAQQHATVQNQTLQYYTKQCQTSIMP